jgi:hypothetical protein
VEHRRNSDMSTAETDPKVAEKAAEAEFPEVKGVRASDIEPYTGLRYLSKLFRFMAVILVLLLVAEIATGLYTQGSAAVPTLLGEASRLIVLAGVLWGVGDLAHLLIDVGHDVRAARILVSRTHGGRASAVGTSSVSRGLADRAVESAPPRIEPRYADRGPDR